ncbi:MAG: 30S ribosomal protein S14 [Bacteroidaceae bacterium]|nr:30S ribosomal protein S14 [Muribaculaceae bacterium]MBR2378178.1 30S ribosomal protein S14 [Bacteroidaceae bacterium]MBR3950928.1 30S ribosomal protein S14 [Bacteroidaceae bacterium]MBR5002551.1 30S ribosomal protein S14 [Bacteroidaceae bacterium]
MAKESMKAREVKRQKLVAKYAARKAELKKLAKSEDYDVAYEANRALQNLPKNASSVRLHNRCQLTGRPKGYIRQFGISRIQFREMASAGLIPGVKKASW